MSLVLAKPLSRFVASKLLHQRNLLHTINTNHSLNEDYSHRGHFGNCGTTIELAFNWCKFANIVNFLKKNCTLLIYWIWCFWNCILVILHLTFSSVQIVTFTDGACLGLGMHTDMNTAKITAETLLELELKSLGLAGVPNRFKTGWTNRHPVYKTFVPRFQLERKIQTVLGTERETKRKKAYLKISSAN